MKKQQEKICSPYLKSEKMYVCKRCDTKKKRHKIKYRRNNSSALNFCVWVCLCVRIFYSMNLVCCDQWRLYENAVMMSVRDSEWYVMSFICKHQQCQSFSKVFRHCSISFRICFVLQLFSNLNWYDLMRFNNVKFLNLFII